MKTEKETQAELFLGIHSAHIEEHWKKQNLEDTLWNRFKCLVNYCYYKGVPLRRLVIIKLFYPNQYIYGPTTSDVYRRLLTIHCNLEDKSTGVYNVINPIDVNLSINVLKRENQLLNKKQK